MSSVYGRLYGREWGKGTIPFESTFLVYDIANTGRTDASYGDKVILPSEAFKKISQLRLEFPLFFRICKSKVLIHKPKVKSNTKIVSSKKIDKTNEHYCGVLEFSAPPSTVFMPFWIMENIGLKDGDSAKFSSKSSIKMGTSCILQPHHSSFLDIIDKFGPKVFLENALRKLSILSNGERIAVEWEGETYSLNVLDCKPDKAINILNDVDLTVDFAPPIVNERNDYKSLISEEILENDIDKLNTISNSDEKLENNVPLQPKNEENEVKNSTFPTTSGYSLRDDRDSDNTVICDNCDRYVPTTSLTLHSVHCQRNFFKCQECFEIVNIRNKEEHKLKHSLVECTQGCNQKVIYSKMDLHIKEQCQNRSVPCIYCKEMLKFHELVFHQKKCGDIESKCNSCKKSFIRRMMDSHICEIECKDCGKIITSDFYGSHIKIECPNRSVLCSFCHLSYLYLNIGEHEEICGSRTDKCDVCGSWITLRDMDLHVNSNCMLGLKNSRDLVNEVKNVIDKGSSLTDNITSLNLGSNLDNFIDNIIDPVPNENMNCPHCKKELSNFEELQMHILTTCIKVPISHQPKIRNPYDRSGRLKETPKYQKLKDSENKFTKFQPSYLNKKPPSKSLHTNQKSIQDKKTTTKKSSSKIATKGSKKEPNFSPLTGIKITSSRFK